jgi:hypothetical protein
MQNFERAITVILKLTAAVFMVVLSLYLAMLIYAMLTTVQAAEPDKEEWTPQQLASEAVALGLLALDYKQTMNLTTKFPGTAFAATQTTDTFRETNPLLGKHPSSSHVKNYFAAVTVGQGVLAAALPSKYRDWALGGLITVELVTTTHNRTIGLSGKF